MKVFTFVTDGWSFSNNVELRQHRNLEDRLATATGPGGSASYSYRNLEDRLAAAAGPG